MMDANIGEHEYCCICGSIITSEASIRRGYGGECAAAVEKARKSRIFSDPELKKQYYSFEARAIICRLEEKRAGFRSQFRKSFADTLIRQHDWLSRKQKDIALDILGIGVADTALVEAREEQKRFLESIPVDRKDIEVARREIRKVRAAQ